jgi:hypothetical protein
MSDTVYVTPAQVLAAQLAVELSEEDGEEPDEALQAIANATVVSVAESASIQFPSWAWAPGQFAATRLRTADPEELRNTAERIQQLEQYPGVFSLEDELDPTIPWAEPEDDEGVARTDYDPDEPIADELPSKSGPHPLGPRLEQSEEELPHRRQ